MFTNTNSVPGAGSGISTAHTAQKFRVRFFEGNTEYTELTREVLSVEPHVYSSAMTLIAQAGGVIRGLDITFVDDQNNNVAKRLSDLHDRAVLNASKPATVTVLVEMVDAIGSPVRTHTYVDCIVAPPTFSKLDCRSNIQSTIQTSFTPDEVRISFP